MGLKPVNYQQERNLHAGESSTGATEFLGASLGLAAGLASERYIQSLLYGVKTTDLTMLALPALTILTTAVLAALPPVIQAVRIDPAITLRAE